MESANIVYRLGDDGSWSTFDFQIGTSSNAQIVSLTVGTALSEIWVVEETGCATPASEQMFFLYDSESFGWLNQLTCYRSSMRCRKGRLV